MDNLPVRRQTASRKWVSLTPELEEKLNDYRFSYRCESETIAVRELLTLGLKILKSK